MEMSTQEHAKYMEARNRGQHDAIYDNPYNVGQEQSDLEMQGYCDGWVEGLDYPLKP
jgi:hypothetical protein